MSECEKCKYAVWDDLELYPHSKYPVVVDCKLENYEDDCEDFDEYLPPLPDGF